MRWHSFKCPGDEKQNPRIIRVFLAFHDYKIVPDSSCRSSLLEIKYSFIRLEDIFEMSIYG